MKKISILALLLIALSLAVSFGAMGEEVCNHNFGQWNIRVPADCETPGVQVRICSICGRVEEEAIPAKGHQFGNWNERVSATCTAPGIQVRICGVCGKVEEEAIPQLPHTEEILPGKAATCTEEGLTEGKRCSVCGAILVAQEPFPPPRERIHGARGRLCAPLPVKKKVWNSASARCATRWKKRRCRLLNTAIQRDRRLTHRVNSLGGRQAFIVRFVARHSLLPSRFPRLGTIIAWRSIRITPNTLASGAAIPIAHITALRQWRKSRRRTNLPRRARKAFRPRKKWRKKRAWENFSPSCSMK